MATASTATHLEKSHSLEQFERLEEELMKESEAATASAPSDLGPDVEGAAVAKPEPSPDGAAAADDDDKKDNKGLYSTDKF